LLNTTNHIVYALPAVNPSVCTVPVTPLSFLTSIDDDPGTTAKLGSTCTSTVSRDPALSGVEVSRDAALSGVETDDEADAAPLRAAAVASGWRGDRSEQLAKATATTAVKTNLMKVLGSI